MHFRRGLLARERSGVEGSEIRQREIRGRGAAVISSPWGDCVVARKNRVNPSDWKLLFSQIRQDLQANGIKVYPQREYDEDAEDRILNDKIRVWGRFSRTSLLYE